MVSTRNVVPWWKEFWQSEHNCSAIATRKERNACMQRVLRIIYDTYIPNVLDAVSGVANAFHEQKNCSSRERKNSGDMCLNYHTTIDPEELETSLHRARYIHLHLDSSDSKNTKRIPNKRDRKKFQKVCSLSAESNMSCPGTYLYTGYVSVVVDCVGPLLRANRSIVVFSAPIDILDFLCTFCYFRR